ncbi:MAG: c-type cytochrome [Panacagrimonas sp.]
MSWRGHRDGARGRRVAFVIALMAALAGSSLMAAQMLRTDDAIKLRRAAYALQGHYFSQLKPMASGAQPFDATRAQQLMAHLEMLSPIPLEFFPEGSEQGDTKAQPEIWRELEDFTARQKQSLTDLRQLSAAAQAGDADRFKAVYLDAAASCKRCHDDYRRR